MHRNRNIREGLGYFMVIGMPIVITLGSVWIESLKAPYDTFFFGLFIHCIWGFCGLIYSLTKLSDLNQEVMEENRKYGRE